MELDFVPVAFHLGDSGYLTYAAAWGGKPDFEPFSRVASVENGSDWVAILARRLRKKANQAPGAFPEDPLDVLRRNVWVTPYYEEDLAALSATIGVERILFGSDWPHGEGLAEPLTFSKELNAFAPDEVRMIMRDNVIDLLGGVTASE